jgi:aminopeptidase N
MLTFFSERFGIHYPWAQYAQVSAFEFPGGMENTSATTMGDRILLDQRSLLDRSAEWIVSHEMAHQWWGDLLTCRDWTHTWLNEGFASYAEALWAEHSKGGDEYAYNMYERIGRAIHDGKSRPVMDRRYTSEDSMFDSRAYQKGAWILHMLRKHVGDEAFWKGIKSYANEHKLQSVETADFRRSMEQATGRSLVRFFYDWLERPGNPDVEVTSEYLPDARQAAIIVKQTQEGEAFHVLLKIVLHQAGGLAPIVLEQPFTEKEISLRVPLKGLLTRVDIDPDLAILTQLKEKKSDDLWRAQLLDATNVPARLRAVQHFAESKADQDRQLLAQAFPREKFWAVRIELAKALGKSRAASSRTALLEGLRAGDARIRSACVEGLGNFKDNADVMKAVREVVKNGDQSYAVEGAALKAYAKLDPKEAVAAIKPWLDKPSHQNVLAIAALDALGQTGEKGALPILLQYSEIGKKAELRRAAMRTLARMAKREFVTDLQRNRLVELLMKDFQESRGFARMTALGTLAGLGSLGKDKLPAIEKIVAESPDGSLVHMLMERSVNRIRQSSDGKANPNATAETTRLRDEVRQLERDRDDLSKRLKKLEKAGAAK